VGENWQDQAGYLLNRYTKRFHTIYSKDQSRPWFLSCATSYPAQKKSWKMGSKLHKNANKLPCAYGTKFQPSRSPEGAAGQNFAPDICVFHRCLCVHNVSNFFEAALFTTGTSYGCQQKHTFINNYLNKASKKMIHNAATNYCRNGGKNHDTQFPADVHSFKLPCFFCLHRLWFINNLFFTTRSASSKVKISAQ